MHFPTFDDIVILNRLAVTRDGCSFYPPYNMSEANAARLRSLLEKAEFPPISHEMYEGVENLAALLCYDIATSHLFLDGNKRTAMAALLGFLRVNELDYLASEREIEEMGWRLADRQATGITREELADWVRMIAARAKPAA